MGLVVLIYLRLIYSRAINLCQKKIACALAEIDVFDELKTLIFDCKYAKLHFSHTFSSAAPKVTIITTHRFSFFI